MLLLISTIVISWCCLQDIVSAYILSPVLNALNVTLKEKKTGKQMNVQVISRWDLRKPAHCCCQKAASDDGQMPLQLTGPRASDGGEIPPDAAEKTALHRTPKEFAQSNAQFYFAINS